MNLESEHQTLWDNFWSNGPEYSSNHSEPLHLVQHIKTIEVNDSWLAPASAIKVPPVMQGDKNERLESEVLEQQDKIPTQLRCLELSQKIRDALISLNANSVTKTNPALIIRKEYIEFFQCALDGIEAGKRNRFFVTGKTFLSYYIVLRLLASGTPFFLVNEASSAYHFSTDGVQRYSLIDRTRSLHEKLVTSWVIIDIDAEWTIPPLFMNPLCLVWTSSPVHSRMKRMRNHFSATIWYMLPWDTTEIVAATELLGLEPKVITKMYAMYGPVARDLFDTAVTTERERIEAAQMQINEMITDARHFLLTEENLSGVQPSHQIFLIRPRRMFDDGRHYWSRSQYDAEFRSEFMAQKFAECAQQHLDLLQFNIATAFNMSSTRGLAGKMFETLIHRAIVFNQTLLPDVFGRVSAPSISITGSTTKFSLAFDPARQALQLPLYLHPTAHNFGAVDAIIVTNASIGLLQISLSATFYRRDFGAMLDILDWMKTGAVCDQPIYYCLVGFNIDNIRRLMSQASKSLEEAKEMDAEELSKAFPTRDQVVAHKHLANFQVVGYIFNRREGFIRV
ncbi:hypothetical protein MIND_00711900 [Mycena indigotica]|uniref:Uncharacterized protein n=1 Tax=Mycena indigotica TaxID=2126181 RepID=A0A8H6SP84_9AGAR|nr:uncharacterized protein MIND_00711900 [Mycena indigotica]KAF7301465.1 hypothetical protein MIND_00711900 [Mycena indigotica]